MIDPVATLPAYMRPPAQHPLLLHHAIYQLAQEETCDVNVQNEEGNTPSAWGVRTLYVEVLESTPCTPS